jgi:outer membrane receptor protein involved in Fe transport
MLRKLTSFCASTALAIAAAPLGIAYAQTAPEAPAEEAEIVVTGSRIPRRDFTAVSPIVTVGAERISESGQPTIEFGLNALPQMVTGTTSTAIQNRTGHVSLDLRGLGEARSLVLLDGRRLQPITSPGVGSATPTVDLTSLPTIMIESVEIITGGASAVYGSDAMAGVVNFRLRRDFSGVLAEGNFNVTEHGGGGSQEYNLVLGDEFDNDAGNAMLVVSYADRNQLRRADRDWFNPSTTNTRIPYPLFNVAANAPSQAAVNTVFAQYGAAPGAVLRTTTIGVNDDLTLFTPNPGGTRAIINFRGQLDAQTILEGANQNQLINNAGILYDLISPIQRFSSFGRVTHSVTDDIEWFGQALFLTYQNLNTVSQSQVGTAGSTASLPVTNPFIPADLSTLLASRANPTAAVPFNYTFTQWGGQENLADTTTYQLVTGLDGELGYRDWSWNAHLSHGRSEVSSTLSTFNLARFQQLMNAPDGGASICTGGFNIFGPPAAASVDCLDYVRAEPTNIAKFEQSVFEANLNGSLFTLPAGDVSFALGAGWRSENYSEQNPEEAVRGEIPGLTLAPSFSGDRDITEAYGELLVPLLSKVPLAHRLELNLAYRYSEYQPGGSVESYTGGFNWSPAEPVMLRAGYSHAIRAPTLVDLFASAVPVSINLGAPSATTSGGDPCDVRSSFRINHPNAASIRQFCIDLGVPAVDTFTADRQSIFGDASGNPDLINESADTYTVGLILQSRFTHPLISRMRFTADYYNIEITDGIGQLPLATALARCFNLDGISNPNYDPNNVNCSFFPRDPATGFIGTVTSRTLNLAKYETSGIDLQFDWTVDTADLGMNIGELGLNVVATYLESFRIQDLPNSPLLEYAGSGGRPRAFPQWKSLTTLTHTAGPFETTLRWRYASSVQDILLVANPTGNPTFQPTADYHYFDLAFRWDVTDTASIRLGIQNLMDKEPFILGVRADNTDLSLYDPIGRNYTLAVRKTF